MIISLAWPITSISASLISEIMLRLSISRSTRNAVHFLLWTNILPFMDAMTGKSASLIVESLIKDYGPTLGSTKATGFMMCAELQILSWQRILLELWPAGNLRRTNNDSSIMIPINNVKFYHSLCRDPRSLRSSWSLMLKRPFLIWSPRNFIAFSLSIFLKSLSSRCLWWSSLPYKILTRSIWELSW